MRTNHGFLSLPLFVRENTVLPVGARDDRPDYDFPRGVTFRVYPLADGATAACTVPDLNGEAAARVEVTRAGNIFRIQPGSDLPPGWAVQLMGIAQVGGITGATVQPSPEGMILVPKGTSGDVEVTLAGPYAVEGVKP
jgi:alpha-D-xyloside xylohydrolase